MSGSRAAQWVALLALSGFTASAECGAAELDEVEISKVTYRSLDPVKPLTVPAELRLPRGNGLPAVVIVHGSAGIDGRGISYARELNKAGIATLEIDMWSARGITGGAAGRPRSVPETLPDAYGALKYLSSHPQINPTKIGIMGFSWGGAVSMLTATRPYTEQYMGNSGSMFVGHAPNYPVCWVYNRVPGYAFASLTGAPVLIQGGDLDTYDLPDTCQNLGQSVSTAYPDLISVRMYRDATHAFDRDGPTVTVTDPHSHLGKGGEVQFVYNPDAAAQARATTVAFFRKRFGM
jgi:dienelactone hydrolase